MPWAVCGEERRLDINTGLPLSALWDAAFDKGLVSFTYDGQPLLGPNLSPAAHAALGIDAAPPIPSLREAHWANLAVHRARYGSK